VDLDGTLDLSDVLELRVKLIRRDGLCGSEQLSLLKRLEMMVLKGCTKPEFEKLAGIIWTLPNALPPRLLKDEKLLQRMMRGLADPE
jgi:hypothetical protein